MSTAVRPLLALRLAARGLVRDPTTTLLAVAVLTLGLAAPVVFFSLLTSAIRPLPVPEGERVVRIDPVLPSADGRALPVAPDDLAAMAGVPGLEATGGFTTRTGTLVAPGLAATRVSLAVLSAEVPSLLQVAPVRGRWPAPGEGAATVLVSEELWTELFESDPDALGRSVLVDGAPRTLVGVLPSGFGFPFDQTGWVVADAGHEPPAMELVARLAPGASRESVEAVLTAAWRNRDALRPAGEVGGTVQVRGFTTGRGEGGEAVAFLGLVLVGLSLLLIAATNVANLLLVRATERVRLLGIQSALGASRPQVALQLLGESSLVAALGGASGLALAGGTVALLERSLAEEHFGYWWMELSVDPRVLAFTAALVVGTALLAGLLPVVRVLRTDLQGILKAESGGVTLGGGGGWSRAFVTTQLGLSCAALMGAAVMGKVFTRTMDLGRALPGEEVLVGTLDLSGGVAGRPSAELVAALDDALAEIPRASAVALATGAPGYREAWGRPEVEGLEPVVATGSAGGTSWAAVTPGYFGLFDLSLRSGRLLDASDAEGRIPVAVVNESFVRRFVPDGRPLGRRVRIAQTSDTTEWARVVGVVEDLPLTAAQDAPLQRVYLSLAQTDVAAVSFLARSPDGGAGLAPAVRRAVGAVDPRIPVWDVRTLADAHAFMVRVPRAFGSLALSGGAAGLLVAAVGLYGLLAFRVRQRRREIGVRQALGAGSGRLAREVLAVAARQLLPAAAVGLGLAWLATPVLAVAGAGAGADVLGFFGLVAPAFLAVGFGAAMVPAWRAAAVDPARVLRGE